MFWLIGKSDWSNPDSLDVPENGPAKLPGAFFSHPKRLDVTSRGVKFTGLNRKSQRDSPAGSGTV